MKKKTELGETVPSSPISLPPVNTDHWVEGRGAHVKTSQVPPCLLGDSRQNEKRANKMDQKGG